MAAEYPELIVHGCTPGFIKTDMTQGSAATGTPEDPDVVELCKAPVDVGALEIGVGRSVAIAAPVVCASVVS